MLKNLLLSTSLLLVSHVVFSQGVAINEDNSSAAASAILDIKSTTKGMLAPRMTEAEKTAIATPATGLLVYQTDGTAGFYYYNGSAWTFINAAGVSGLNSLSRTTTEPAGINCTTGGIKVEYGLDIDRNGTLDAGEENAALTKFVCNGAAGPAGATGATGAAGQGVPTGGTANQVLTKVDGTDYNTQWTTVSSGSSSRSLTVFSGFVGTTNNGGNGTFYLVGTGLNANEKDGHRIVAFNCTKLTLSASMAGTVSNSYTLKVRRGVPNAGGYIYSDIASTTITVSNTTFQTVSLTGLSINAGETVAIELVGTASFNSVGQQQTLHASLILSE